MKLPIALISTLKFSFAKEEWMVSGIPDMEIRGITLWRLPD